MGIGFEEIERLPQPATESQFLFYIFDPENGFGMDNFERFFRAHVRGLSPELLSMESGDYKYSIKKAPFISGLADNTVSISLAEDHDYRVLEFLEAWRSLVWNNEDTVTVNGFTFQNALDTVNPPVFYRKDAVLQMISPHTSVGNDNQIRVMAEVFFREMVPVQPSETDYNYDSENAVIWNIDFEMEDFDVNIPRRLQTV